MDLNMYVETELRRLRESTHRPAELHRMEYLVRCDRQRMARRHAVAHWLGNRFVGLGEALRGWALRRYPRHEAERPVRTSLYPTRPPFPLTRRGADR